MTGGLFYFCRVVKINPHQLILPTAYLPPVAWFHFLMKYETVLIEQHETYPRQTYRNRCEILTEKRVMPLSVPVTKVHGNHTKSRDILLNFSEPWPRNHWRAICAAYQNSPYFLYYRDALHQQMSKSHSNLLEFNRELILLLCEWLDINKDFRYTESYARYPDDSIDLRNMTPKQKWYKGKLSRYIQVFSERHEFAENLSIIDLLFNLGPDAAGYLKECKIEV